MEVTVAHRAGPHRAGQSANHPGRVVEGARHVKRDAEGELVRIGEVCARDRANPDGGCGRGFGGLNSHRATTTAMVADTPLERAEYVEAVRSSLQQQGYDPCAYCSVDEADALAALVGDWPVGTVVERRLNELVVREMPGAGKIDLDTQLG